MVRLQMFGSTSKFCFICTAPCFVPRDCEQTAQLTGRDRRHLCNVRVLGRQGISHPGLSWRYSEVHDAMVCLGYMCRVYKSYDPHAMDCCLTVHRSCYTLLLGQLERTEGIAGSDKLMQRIGPYIDGRGVLSTWLMTRCPGTPKAKAPKPWRMCDPTDLPSMPHSPREQKRPPPLRLQPRDVLFGDMEPSLDEAIPQQLLTPPPSPTGSSDDADYGGIACGQQALKAPPPPLGAPPTHNRLIMLLPHILLSVVSYLHEPEIIALSQTCALLRAYLAPESPVWVQLCRLTLNYTPRFMSNREIAEYYLRVRGNKRLETRVLVQRERVERVIHHIVHCMPRGTFD